MARNILTLAIMLLTAMSLHAQLPPRPDALPPVTNADDAAKAVNMATTLDEMYRWNRYPTYEVYLAMMQHFADTYPTLCHIDTIGRTVQNRLILCAVMHDEPTDKAGVPQFFYSSTIHGDEVTGYYLMLRLIDTLLSGYGSDPHLTALLRSTEIFINPLANPDGTYIRGNSNVRYSQRYNANNVDLNRNYPDPFGTDPLTDIQPENVAMMNYIANHHFRLSANLHGGAEVLNYPWDSFTSAERQHPYSEWWQQVCRRFVDTARSIQPNILSDVTTSGHVAGGDWYVISNGRQDYVNQVAHCLELTMELSTDKILSTSLLNKYWQTFFHPLVGYIAEIHNLPSSGNCTHPRTQQPKVYPNPTHGTVTIETPTTSTTIDLTDHPAGLHLLTTPDGTVVKVIKL
ncbi:MAG: hypothetical protein IJU81_09420 [Bacteroidales bacterium]|nr:hypothetical protein [Bacteroidales bacterium]